MRVKEGEKSILDAGERAATETDGTDGADSVFVGQADVCAVGFFVGGHLGHDRNTHAGSHHAEQAAELAAFKHNLRMEARAIAGRQSIFAKAVAVSQEEEGLRTEVSQGESRQPREAVIFGNGSEQGFREYRKRLELLAADGKSEKGEIYGRGANAFKENGSDFLNDRDLGLRKFSREGREVRRQEVRSHGGDDADRDGATHGFLLIGDIATGSFEFAEHSACPGKKSLAKVGQSHGTAQAIKEASAQFVFKLADLL